MRWQGAAAAVWAVGAMGLSFRDLDVAVLDGPDLIRLPRLLRRLRDEVRARDPDAAYARGCLRGACAGGRGVAYVRHADDRAPGPGAYSLHVGAFGPRGELEGPGVLCAGGGGDEAGGAACAGGVYAGRFRNDSLARGTLADPAAAEEYAGDFGADLRYDGLGVRTVAAKTRAGEFRRGAWKRAQRTGSAEAARRAARGAAQAAKAAAALLHDQAVWTKRRSRCMLCAPPDGDLRAPAPSGRTTGAGLWYLWPWTSPLWLCLAAFALLAAWAYRLRRLAAPGRRVRRPPPAARARWFGG